MGYRPRPVLAPCPVCGSICGGPRVQSRFRFRTGSWYRLACPCGVSGPWQNSEYEHSPEHLAARGWVMIAGEVERPPLPRR